MSVKLELSEMARIVGCARSLTGPSGLIHTHKSSSHFFLAQPIPARRFSSSRSSASTSTPASSARRWSRSCRTTSTPLTCAVSGRKSATRANALKPRAMRSHCMARQPVPSGRTYSVRIPAMAGAVAGPTRMPSCAREGRRVSSSSPRAQSEGRAGDARRRGPWPHRARPSGTGRRSCRRRCSRRATSRTPGGSGSR